MDTGGAHETKGGCVQKHLQKYSALFLGFALGCQGTEVRQKHKEAEQVSKRHEAVDMN